MIMEGESPLLLLVYGGCLYVCVCGGCLCVCTLQACAFECSYVTFLYDNKNNTNHAALSQLIMLCVCVAHCVWCGYEQVRWVRGS